MNRNGKLMMVLLMAAVGLWGCSQAATVNPRRRRKDQTLEARDRQVGRRFQIGGVGARPGAGTAGRPSGGAHPDAGPADGLAEGSGRRQGSRQGTRRPAHASASLNGARDLLQTRCEKLKTGLQALIGQDDAPVGPEPIRRRPWEGSPAAARERGKSPRGERGRRGEKTWPGILLSSLRATRVLRGEEYRRAAAAQSVRFWPTVCIPQ